MTQTVAFVVPGSIGAMSGGYGYDRRLIAGLEARGWIVDARELPGAYPWPSAADRAAAADLLASLPDRMPVIIDGLALGALPDEAHAASLRLRLIGLVHHPLALETGLSMEAVRALALGERRALEAVRFVVVTSRRTAGLLGPYGVTQDIIVAQPGTDRAPLARGSGGTATHLLAVGAFIPRKGYDILARALADLSAADWHLTCVGSLTRDPALVSDLFAAFGEAGLNERVTFAGEIHEAGMGAYYDGADVFVAPTRYEGYGMAVAEAVARGLPVVATSTGAIPELVEDRHSGLLAPPGDAASFAEALSAAVVDPALRARLAVGARRMRDRLPTWEDCAAMVDAALNRLGVDE